MSDQPSTLLAALASREPLESFTLEVGPAFFASHQGERTAGVATVRVSRPSVAISFRADNGLVVPKAGYGESNGKITALNGVWSAPHVNDAGDASTGERLFGTRALTVGRQTGQAIAATRLVIAGAAWRGDGVINGRQVLARVLSRDTVSHHDLRMSITVEGDVDPGAVETMGRACSFVSGIDVEVLRVERYAVDGTPVSVDHWRGFRRVGRAPHSPFTAVPDSDRMRAWVALVEAFPRLLEEGVPIDMVIDQISAHNQVSQIHLGATLLLLATVTTAYHRTHGAMVDQGAASRRQELSRLNSELSLGISEEDVTRLEQLRVELLDTGFFHQPGYETGRPQKDIKFIRDTAHAVVLRLCGYCGPFYSAEQFCVRELAEPAN